MVVTVVLFRFRVSRDRFVDQLRASDLVLVERVRLVLFAWQDAPIRKNPTVGIRIYGCHGGARPGSICHVIESTT